MIIGIGIDLVQVDRIRVLLERHGDRARERLFTPRELADCDERVDPSECLAARFAAKEATLKALGIGKQPGARWTDMETVRTESGCPRLELWGWTAEQARGMKLERSWVSLSHEAGFACAVVVLEGRSS